MRPLAIVRRGPLIVNIRSDRARTRTGGSRPALVSAEENRAELALLVLLK